MGLLKRKKGYVTYESGASVPDIDASVRQRSRYGGVGDTAGDDLLDFFSEPDEPPLDHVTAHATAFDRGPLGVCSVESGFAFEPQGGARIPLESENASQLGSKAEPASEPALESASKPVSASVPEPSSDAEPSESAKTASDYAKFARFKSVYESRDGRLCVFEDESGHLVAVDARRLA